MNHIPQIILIIEAFIFGLLIGSFLNVCIYRIPYKRSLLGRSACPACGKPIPFYWNVPVFAFLLLRGKSACCQKPMSWQYPVVEFMTGLISVVTLLHSQVPGFTPTQNLIYYFVWFLLFMAPLIVISVIDLNLRIIPDVISLPFILVGIAVNVYYSYPDIWSALKFSGLGILIGGGTLLLIAEIFSRILKKDAMGGGDIKIMAMMGAFLGPRAVFFIFFASSVLAMVYFLLAALLKKGKQNRVIPFGPFLSLAAMIYWLRGEELLRAYILWIKG